MANTTNNDPISETLDTLKGGIIKLQNPNGWYPFAISKERSIAGIWATGEAVAALSQIDATFYSKEIHSAIGWLISHQKKDGGWGVMLQENASVESTTWVITSLSKFESEEHEPLTKATKGLKTNQNEDGGFGPWKEHPIGSDPWSTGVVLWGLSKWIDNVDKKVIEKAIDWLKKTQLPNGYWPYHYLDDGTSMALIGAVAALKALAGNN